MPESFIDRTLRYFQRPAILMKNQISHNLGGVVGQNLIPHDYHIDETGNIMLKGTFFLIRDRERIFRFFSYFCSQHIHILQALETP